MGRTETTICTERERLAEEYRACVESLSGRGVRSQKLIETKVTNGDYTIRDRRVPARTIIAASALTDSQMLRAARNASCSKNSSA